MQECEHINYRLNHPSRLLNCESASRKNVSQIFVCEFLNYKQVRLAIQFAFSAVINLQQI